MKKITLPILIAVLFLSQACSDSCEKQVNDLKAEIEAYKEQEEMMTSAMDGYNEQLDQYKLKEDTLASFKDSISLLSEEIKRKGRSSYKDNKKLKQYMEQVRRLLEESRTAADLLKNYVDSVDLGENPALVVELLAKNLDAKEKEINNLQTQVNDLKKQVKGLEFEVTEIKTKKDSVEQKNDKLVQEKEEIINEASDLVATNIGVSFYTKKNKQLDRTKLRGNLFFIKRIQTLKVCVSITENQFAKKGTQKLYICIVHNGKVLHHSNNIFTTPQGKEIGYTIEKQIDFTGDKLRVCPRWDKKNIDLEKGTYSIVVYSDNGVEIGSTNFTL